MKGSAGLLVSTTVAIHVESCLLPSLFFFFSVLSPSTLDTAHMRKNTRFSLPTQLQCSRSGAGEPGNEATYTIGTPTKRGNSLL